MDYGFLAYDIYCGVDVGKSTHAMAAISSKNQKIIFWQSVPQDEHTIREVFLKLSSNGRMLVTVDQTGNIGKLVICVAQSLGIDVAFLTPHDFHVLSQAYSEAKSDPIDGRTIADISMRLVHVLHPVSLYDEPLVELKLLGAQRSGLVRESTRIKNQIRDIFVQIHPALETVLDLDSEVYLRLLEHYGGPNGLKRAGRKRVGDFTSKIRYQANRSTSKVEAIFDALKRQDIALPGTAMAENLLKRQAIRLLAIQSELKHLASEIEQRFATFPEAEILLSMPGVGSVFGATLLCEIGDIGRFENAGRLAAYGGVAPCKKQSGLTLDSSKKKKRCNRVLKNAFCRSAWIASQTDDRSTRYYRKKRGEGKSHQAAVLALARHRTDILYAMLKNGSLYEPKTIER